MEPYQPVLTINAYINEYGTLLTSMEQCYQVWNNVNKYGTMLTSVEQC